MGPAFLGWLGERLGSRPGSLDVVLAAGGLGGSPPLKLTPGVDALVQARGVADRPVGGVALLGTDGVASPSSSPTRMSWRGNAPAGAGPNGPCPVIIAMAPPSAEPGHG